MSYSIRHLAPESSFCQELHLDVFDHIIAPTLIGDVLTDTHSWEHRERQLNMPIIVSLVIAMGLMPTLSIPHVLQKMAQGLRYLWPDPDLVLPGASALSQRRQQLGVKPMRELFERVCVPQATPDMPFAFAFGLLLMAIDGTSENVADSFVNDLTFGRPHSQHGAGSFPQVRGVYLQECATHQIIDAAFGAYDHAEQALAYQLVGRMQPGMLVLLDRGFFSARFLHLLRCLRVHVIARLASNMVPRYLRQLKDGSYLAYLYPHDDSGHQRGTPMLVRIIEYTINDPGRVGHGELHRLVTTLLNPRTIPAEQVIQVYHERWELEITIDEIDTHQRLCQHTLRSQKPDGVIQELYGILLGHYGVRSLMTTSAHAQHLDSDRLSFTHAITVVTNAISDVQQTLVSQRDALIERLLRDLRQDLLPQRRLRCNPRVVKSRRAKFPARTLNHRMVPKLEKPFAEILVVLTQSLRFREPLPLKRIQKIVLLT
jgi:Insertion element 4 transposase N-terminal/Transposase DDE domain